MRNPNPINIKKLGLKIFSSDLNNAPVAWIVDYRGNNYSEIYRGKTIAEAKRSLLDALINDDKMQEFDILPSDVKIS